MRVAVVGAGYVGLTTAAALAWTGHRVRVVEVDERKLGRLATGRAPFFEAHLDDAIAHCGDRLTFTPSHGEALEGADVAFIAVGTPPDAEGAPDLRQVRHAVRQVVATLETSDRSLVLVMKSTVPVGIGDELTREVAELRPPRPVVLASNPEFLRQGRALQDSLYPDRIVIGGPDEAVDALRELYRSVVERAFAPPAGLQPPEREGRVPVLEVDRRSAELAKYAANAFLAMRISFINEMANVCDRVGADIDAVASVIGSDPRIGRHFLHAGVGYGGSCFPKDTRALHHIATTNGYDLDLLPAIIRVNEGQRVRVLDKLRDRLGDLRGKRVALLGLAFKPGTDDMREAPSVPLAHTLVERGAEVRGHDPQALENAAELLPAETHLTIDVWEAVEGADAVVLLTEWPEYQALDPARLRAAMRRPLVVDGRNALPDAFRRELEYVGIGRGVPLRVALKRDALAAD